MMNAAKISRMITVALGTVILAGCENAGRVEPTLEESHAKDSIFDDSADVIIDSLFDEEPPMPEWHSDPKNVYCKLTDSEISNLSFTGYFIPKWTDAVGDALDRWTDFIGEKPPYYSKLTCPICGQHLLVIYSESPQEYWQQLAGIGGYFFICTHCKRVLDFECTILN